VIKTAIPWLSVIFKLLVASGSGILAFAGISEFVSASSSGGFDSSQSKTDSRGAVLALVMVVSGGCLYVARLGDPMQVMAIVRNVSSGSPASWEFLIYLLVLICSAICLVVVRREGRLGGILSALCILLALMMGFITGYYHMAMIGTPAWHTPAIPLGFTTSALLLGGFIYVALAGYGSEKSSKKNKSKTIEVFLVALAVVTGGATVTFGISTAFGSYAPLYWMATPVTGGVISATAAVMSIRTRRVSLRWARIGVLTSLVGALAFRASLWLVGSTIPMLFRG
jgi:formate-dependent nitrite reductase membrane component NrfD